MYILLFLAILVVVYVTSFKDNFTQANIEKVTPVLVVSVLFIVFISILSAVL